MRTTPDNSRGHATDASALTPREVLLADAIAERVADRLSPRDVSAGHQLVSAAEVARELGVGRQWVYEHAEQLGARRLGDGPRARLRFDLETVHAASVCLTSKQSHVHNPTTGAKSTATAEPSTHRLPNRLPQPGSILPSDPAKRDAQHERTPHGTIIASRSDPRFSTSAIASASWCRSAPSASRKRRTCANERRDGRSQLRDVGRLNVEPDGQGVLRQSGAITQPRGAVDRAELDLDPRRTRMADHALLVRLGYHPGRP